MNILLTCPQIIYLILIIISVAGDPPHFAMHAAIERNFLVSIGFPVGPNGERVLHFVGNRAGFKAVLDYCGKIAEGIVKEAPLTPIKAQRRNVERGKTFYCLYCSKPYLNRVFEHCELVHPTETLVMEIMALPNGSAERREKLRVSNLFCK